MMKSNDTFLLRKERDGPGVRPTQWRAREYAALKERVHRTLPKTRTFRVLVRMDPMMRESEYGEREEIYVRVVLRDGRFVDAKKSDDKLGALKRKAPAVQLLLRELNWMVARKDWSEGPAKEFYQFGFSWHNKRLLYFLKRRRELRACRQGAWVRREELNRRWVGPRLSTSLENEKIAQRWEDAIWSRYSRRHRAETFRWNEAYDALSGYPVYAEERSLARNEHHVNMNWLEQEKLRGRESYLKWKAKASFKGGISIDSWPLGALG